MEKVRVRTFGIGAGWEQMSLSRAGNGVPRVSGRLPSGRSRVQTEPQGEMPTLSQAHAEGPRGVARKSCVGLTASMTLQHADAHAFCYGVANRFRLKRQL